MPLDVPRGKTAFSPCPTAGAAPSCRKRGRLSSAVKEGGCGGGCLDGGEGRFSAPRRSAGSPLFLKGAIWLRCLLPFPWKGRTGCLWTCRGKTVFSPVSDHPVYPSLVEEEGSALPCGGGRLRGRMFGRWKGPVFLVPGTLPPERSHSIWRYHLCLFKRGGGAPLGAPGNGRSSPGGQQRDKRVWRRHSPSSEKEGEGAPPAGRKGHLSWHSARRRATLPAGRAVAPAKRAGGITVFSTAGGLSPRRGQRETRKTGLQITGLAGLCRQCDRVPPHLARRFWLIHPLFPHLCNCATD